jgi:hypothetical protein
MISPEEFLYLKWIFAGIVSFIVFLTILSFISKKKWIVFPLYISLSFFTFQYVSEILDDHGFYIALASLVMFLAVIIYQAIRGGELGWHSLRV